MNLPRPSSICVNTDNSTVNANGHSCYRLNWLYDNGESQTVCQSTSDTSVFTASTMCCACGGGTSWTGGIYPGEVEVRCEDASSVHVDSQNQSCTNYNSSRCESYDTATFNSSSMCCECGGGNKTTYSDAKIEALSSEGHSCSDISKLVSYGFDETCSDTYDTFISRRRRCV